MSHFLKENPLNEFFVGPKSLKIQIPFTQHDLVNIPKTHECPTTHTHDLLLFFFDYELLKHQQMFKLKNACGSSYKLFTV